MGDPVIFPELEGPNRPGTGQCSREQWVQTDRQYSPDMRCHYCSRDADLAIEKDLVKVGLCEEHLRARLDELAEADWLEDFEDHLDLE